MWGGCMSQRKGWALSLFFIVLVAFVVLVLMLVVTFFFNVTGRQVTHTVQVLIDISDRGRNLMVMMNSFNATAGMSNLELMSLSLVANFDQRLLRYVTEDAKSVEGTYIAIGGNRLAGERPVTVVTAEIPVPGAGKSGQTKETVSLG